MWIVKIWSCISKALQFLAYWRVPGLKQQASFIRFGFYVVEVLKPKRLRKNLWPSSIVLRVFFPTVSSFLSCIQVYRCKADEWEASCGTSQAVNALMWSPELSLPSTWVALTVWLVTEAPFWLRGTPRKGCRFTRPRSISPAGWTM